MQCKCGKHLADRESVRSRLKLRLSWAECHGCGRTHVWALRQAGKVVAKGEAAREKYLKIIVDP
jgi:hypothetical protein